jgi:Arc/MetJ-type ribon-helix-helix transcriptional regulator
MDGKKQNRNRGTISVTLPPDVLAWLDKKVEDRTYSSRSFAIEKAVLKLMKEEATKG